MCIITNSRKGTHAWCIYCGWATLLSAMLYLTGCGGDSKEYREYGEQDRHAEEKGLKEAEHDHDHGHGAGPHGGHLLELGEHEYHAEVVFDAESRKTTIYILGADAKSPLPIAADAVQFDLEEEGKDEIELATSAVPLDGEPEGKSSRFEVAGDALPEEIKSEEDFEGHLHIMIEGKEYEGELHHDGDHEHGDHDHDGDHKHEDKDGHEDDHDDDHKDDDDKAAADPEDKDEDATADDK